VRIAAIRFIFVLFLVLLLFPAPVRADPPKLPEEVVKALDSASSVTLYSIQPWGGPDLPEWDFHGHHQLGHVDLTQEKAKQAIAALNDAISTGTANMESLCLINPRHALRVISGRDTYDILICYECGQLELFKNNQRLPFSGTIGRSPGALNGLLQGSHIPLAGDKDALNASYNEETKAAMQRAEQGDTKAQEVIGEYLMSGRGVKKDEEQGIKWLAKSSGTPIDDPSFEVKVGKMLSHNRDTAFNFEEQMKLFRMAADQGNAEGQYQVGYFYELGEGVTKDQTEALTWFHKAADQGNPKAQYELGVCYARGWAVKEDDSEALKWLLKAAEQGHPEAMFQIGGMYQSGKGIGKDLGEAFFWYQLAQEYHSTYGQEPLNVSPEQKAAAEQRVRDWKSKHSPMPR